MIHMEERLRNLVDQVTYKPGWKVQLGSESGRWYVRWAFRAVDHEDGRAGLFGGRKWWLSNFMTDSEVVSTLLMAALAAEEYECREAFLYRGQRVFGPHLDVNWMAARLREDAEGPIDVRD